MNAVAARKQNFTFPIIDQKLFFRTLTTQRRTIGLPYMAHVQAFASGWQGKRNMGMEMKNGVMTWTRPSKRGPFTSVCARKMPNGLYYGNSASLSSHPLHEGNRQMAIQVAMSDFGFIMLPFNVIEERGLRLEDINIIDRGPEEVFPRFGWRDDSEKVHFTGALLFEANGKFFLMDLDREDLKHSRMNPFLSVLPRPVWSIHEAYDSLMPQAVRFAIERGLKVQRQGEWFLIPVPDEKEEFKSKTKRCGDGKEYPDSWSTHCPIVLDSKGHRPHRAEHGKGVDLVAGWIKHDGYEHTPIFLKTWHQAVPNSAIESFKIVGGHID